MDNPDQATIVVAGATGNLGGRIADVLVTRGANVRAVVRPGGPPERQAKLRERGVSVVEADPNDVDALARACEDADCVVSALSGLRDVIVKKQGWLLDAAIRAGVPRFIPSDFAADFTRLAHGTNRNFDLRREFHERLDAAPIAATSILNGMFAELLTGAAPIVLFAVKRVLYWENPDQPLDFTTMDDTARYTAEAALDRATPRILRIAGDSISARELAKVASEVTGATFHLLRGGSLKTLDTLIDVMRIVPSGDALYPPWQGMQYLRSMFAGDAKLAPLDNDRYPDLQWTTARDVLAKRNGRNDAPEAKESAR